MGSQIDESLKKDKNVSFSEVEEYSRAMKIKNLISLAILSNPGGVTLDQLTKSWLAPFNVKQDTLLRWLQGRGRLGKILGGSFILEEAEPRKMTKVRFRDDETCWLAFVFQYGGSLNFGKYENKILGTLFSPEREKYERDEYVLFYQGKFLSFIRERKKLNVLYPIQFPSKFIKIRFDEETGVRAEFTITDFSEFTNIMAELNDLTGLKDASWTLIEPLIVKCKKELLKRIEERGGLLISELKETGLYGPEAETSR